MLKSHWFHNFNCIEKAIYILTFLSFRIFYATVNCFGIWYFLCYCLVLFHIRYSCFFFFFLLDWFKKKQCIILKVIIFWIDLTSFQGYVSRRMSPTSGGVVTLKTGRQEVQGSNSGRACRLSRSEFSVVFSETRVNTG